MENATKKRRGGALIFLLVLILAVLAAAGMVSAFKLGMATALSASGGALLIYHVPAALHDWPRLTLSDVGDFFEAVWDWFTGLFGW